jgi:hypothetical protein
MRRHTALTSKIMRHQMPMSSPTAASNAPLRLISGVAFALTTFLLSRPSIANGAGLDLALRCTKQEYGRSDPVLCVVELVNHLADRQVVLVPTVVTPIPLAHRPTSILHLDVAMATDHRLLPNIAPNRKGAFDLPLFSASELQALFPARLTGWEVDLRNGPYWQYLITPGRYRVRARVVCKIAAAVERSKELGDAIEHRFGGRGLKTTLSSILDGEFSSNEVGFTVSQSGGVKGR